MTTYTVTNENTGEVIDTGCTAVEAMDLMLTYDGHEWEIRADEDAKGFWLWTSDHSRNSTAWNGLTRASIFSVEDDPAAAEQDIALKAITGRWRRKPAVYTDASYEAMMAELAADEAKYG